MAQIYTKEVIQASKTYNLPLEVLEHLKNQLDFKTFKKGAVLIERNQNQNQFFILKSGIARVFITDEKGKDFTRSLFVAGEPIAPIREMLTDSKIVLNYDCLTDCEMYCGNFVDFFERTQTDLQIATIYNKMLEKAYLNMEERVFELSFDAQEKYQKLKNRIPDIDNLIPQYQIASYLNISNVQLSRVRKKMLIDD